jgi:uncharacterized membrane protein
LKRVTALLAWILQSFGPIVVFLVVKAALGLRPAIIASLVWSVLDALYVVVWKRDRPTPFFYFSVTTTLVFGVVDLYATNPFLFRYEAALTNVLTGLYFGATVFVGKPLIQEFAEKAKGVEDIAKPSARAYLRFLTVVWSGYFFAKALTYYYLAQSDLSYERTALIRAALGPLSLGAMLGGERLLRPLTIRALRALRVIPASAAS